MRAWIGEGAGDSATYRCGDIPMPELRPGELLVRVKATGLNRVDQRPKTQHFSHTEPTPVAIPGLEMAGEVAGVAAPAGDFALGDRVMAMVQGGAAEFVRIHHRLALNIPPDIPWAIAGTIPISYLTAYDAMVMRGRFPNDGQLLVHAVTSGVGIASVQLGCVLGAASIGGSSSSPTKLEAMMSHGLTFGILDPYAGFASRVMDATSGHGADVVVDNIGGTILNETIRATAVEGRVVDVGRLGGIAAELDLDLLALRRVSLIGVTFRTRTLAQHAEICAQFMQNHTADLVNGRLKPIIAGSFDFDDLPAAIAYARSERLIGKVVLMH